jgi:hypothetical protein
MTESVVHQLGVPVLCFLTLLEPEVELPIVGTATFSWKKLLFEVCLIVVVR